MYHELKQQIAREAQRFRAWANDRPDARWGEWETAYPGWDAIMQAFSQLMQDSFHETWDDEIRHDVLYLIARDNESESLIALLAEHTDRLLAFAGLAVTNAESDARWQFADRLGDLHARTAEAEAMLIQFAQDDDEYVRRRALLALAELGSKLVETMAETAWSTGHEYQRIAALHALSMIDSAKLSEYLARAAADGRPALVANAARIQARNIDERFGLRQ